MLLPIKLGGYLMLRGVTHGQQPPLNEASPISRICLETKPSPNAEVRGRWVVAPFAERERCAHETIVETTLMAQSLPVSSCLRSLHPAVGVWLAVAGGLSE